MKYITPISERQRLQVVARTAGFIQHGSKLFGRKFAEIPVVFDLSGGTAGMYRVRDTQRVIRYNPWIFAKYFDDSMAVTVPHEVAHYLVDCLHGLGKVRPHGVQWRGIMNAFGVEPRATGSFDLAGIPMRRQRRFTYHCECSTHQLATRRHNSVQRGEARYRCRDCGEALTAAS